MPRLAPSNCELQRLELGTYERQLMKKYLAEQKRANTLNAITNIGKAGIFSFGGIAAAFIGGMFLAPNMIEEVKEKIQVVKEVVDNQINNSSGQNKTSEDGQEGGYATVLCVGYKDERQLTGEKSPNEGKVVVAPGAGVPIIGGLSGAALYVVTYGQDDEEWVGIWGNKNKKATTIDELTQPWYYLDPKTGGPLY
jgi:hypothetical protein